MGTTVVYTARGGADLEAVMKRLRKAKLHPAALDNPDPIVVHKSFGTYKIRVGVPADEAVDARKVLAEWSAESAPRVTGHSRLFLRQLMLSLPIGLGIGALFYLYETDTAIMGFFFGTIGALIVISNVQARKRNSE